MPPCPLASPEVVLDVSCRTSTSGNDVGPYRERHPGVVCARPGSMVLSLASTIAAALSKSNIKTVDEFARAVELAPGFIANLLRNEGIQAQAQRLHSEMSTMTDTVVLDVATQTRALTGDVVDISTAEAMVEEALCMVAEAEEGERDAQKCAREWLDRAELGNCTA